MDLGECRFAIRRRAKRGGSTVGEIPLRIGERGAQCVEPGPRTRFLPRRPLRRDVGDLALCSCTDDDTGAENHHARDGPAALRSPQPDNEDRGRDRSERPYDQILYRRRIEPTACGKHRDRDDQRPRGAGRD